MPNTKAKSTTMDKGSANMKSLLRVACVTLPAFAFSVAYAQEAQVEQIHIFENTKGVVYLNEAFHINEKSGPVQVTRVVARHIPSKTATLANAYYDALFRYLEDNDKDRLRRLAKETLTITIDAEGEEVVAVKFGIIVYDAFKEYLGGLTGVTMDPPKFEMQWEYSPAYLFKFEKFGVAGVYVRQARLKDGTIWNFDEDLITKKLSERLGEITKEQIVGSDS